MNAHAKNTITPTLQLLIAVLLSLSACLSQANTLPQIPEIPAFLPLSTSVPMGRKLPIDGDWMISSIRKRIRIEGGRAYALDPWLHLFVLKVEPHMVVIKDIQRSKRGHYVGQDLPLMGQFSAQLMPDGSLKSTVAGMFGPVKYSLMPLRMDSARAIAREQSGGRGGSDDSNDYDDGFDGADDDDSEGFEDDGADGFDEGSDGFDEGSDGFDEGSDGFEEGFEDEGDFFDEEGIDAEEELPRKIAAAKIRRAQKGCKGKQLYLSGGACYSCPKGYRRVSPTRKMTHPKACTQRGFGNKTVKAKYRWQANGCPKGLFKHKGYCKSCPEGSKRIHVAGLDTGYCKVLAF